jgi:two-component system response regulator
VFLLAQVQTGSPRVERFRPVEILLVEDNLDDVAITERAFARSYVVSRLTVARDGQEVLNLLLGDRPAGAPSPDLMLLDVNLPKRNGLEVLAIVRETDAFATLPIVMLTASGRVEDVTTSYQLGANSYIQKPVLFEKLTRTLEVLAQYWFEVATLPPP